ncbi:hypothetical protein EV426DRAFT_611205 [Tirmania nivea]|nr:hypothetical protein EV426DRAFT_611205 [Tirmania nivea]
MSAGVLGPFTFDGFVAYIALSTTESVSAEAVEIFSSKFTSQFQQFIQSTYIESPPKDSAQAKLTPISKEQSTSTSKAEKNTSTLAVSSSTKGKGPTVRITPRSITESESESESESEPEPEDDDRLEATGANTFKGAGHQVAMSGFGSVVTQSTTSLRNSSRKGSRYKEKAMGAVNKALETVGDAACRMAPRLRGIRNRKSNIVVSEKIDTNGAYEMTMISAESPPAQQVQPFSPTSPSESRFGRGRLIRGEIPPGIVFNLQKKLEAVEPGQTVITGGPLPLSRRNSSAQRNGTLEYIPKATFSNIEQKEATAKLAKATATVGRWGSPSFTTADSRRRSSAFSSFSRSDSEEDSIPVKPRGPPLRNVEIRSASCSYDPRITRKKLAVQAHSYEPGNAFMISNCTEGLALHGQLSLSTGSSTAQSLSCSGHIHSTDYSQQTSRGDWLQCSCGGHGIPDVTARQQTANPQTVSAQLMAQLQALIGKIYAQTGQLVVPKLNVHMACEGSESAEEMMEMEVDVRLKYVSNKTVEHVGPCTQLREFLGVGSTCAVMEELLQN